MPLIDEAHGAKRTLPSVVAKYAGSGANVWETWYYNGYLYTGDMGRGMDIIDIA